MAGSVNKVILVGNLGKDPEIRRTQDGRPIANLSVATSESWRDKTTGERKEKTEWHRVVIFNEGLCKIVEQYLKKARIPAATISARAARPRRASPRWPGWVPVAASATTWMTRFRSRAPAAPRASTSLSRTGPETSSRH